MAEGAAAHSAEYWPGMTSVSPLSQMGPPPPSGADLPAAVPSTESMNDTPRWNPSIAICPPLMKTAQRKTSTFRVCNLRLPRSLAPPCAIPSLTPFASIRTLLISITVLPNEHGTPARLTNYAAVGLAPSTQKPAPLDTAAPHLSLEAASVIMDMKDLVSPTEDIGSILVTGLVGPMSSSASAHLVSIARAWITGQGECNSGGTVATTRRLIRLTARAPPLDPSVLLTLSIGIVVLVG